MDSELVRRRLVDSRSAAQRAIEAGRVVVGGVAVPKPSTMVAPSDPVSLSMEAARYVGRGGDKLEAALDHAGIDPAGSRAVDVGASTGGFTDCLLQRGAVSVTAVDVGYGQLHWRLRSDPRVRVVERTNIRHADPSELGAPFDIVVADLSFISLTTVASQLAALGGPGTRWVVLVKPQFEVGKERVPKGGVVRDPADRAGAVRRVRDTMAEHGVGAFALVRSPVTGAAGNVEFLLAARWGAAQLGDHAIDVVVGAS